MVVGIEFFRFQPCENPAQGGVVPGLAAHLPETGSVPQLVAEIFSALDAVFLKADVLALWRNRNDAEAQAVRPILVDQVERIR